MFTRIAQSDLNFHEVHKIVYFKMLCNNNFSGITKRGTFKVELFY